MSVFAGRPDLMILFLAQVAFILLQVVILYRVTSAMPMRTDTSPFMQGMSTKPMRSVSKTSKKSPARKLKKKTTSRRKK